MLDWKRLQPYINLIKFDILVCLLHFFGTNLHGFHLKTQKRIQNRH